ncbi:zinc finger, CCHC-type containing protein [Tanacetum coccineum]
MGGGNKVIGGIEETVVSEAFGNVQWTLKKANIYCDELTIWANKALAAITVANANFAPHPPYKPVTRELVGCTDPICDDIRYPKDHVCEYTNEPSLGRILEEIHVTWAHLEKKRTRLRLYTKSFKKLCIQSVETASRVSSDDVRTFEVTASEIWENVVPLRSDSIRLVQNGCSFHGLRSEDPNQHLKDFLKLVDSLDLDGANRERTRLRLFQFSLRDQASNWLERLPAGSITTWEDLTTHFLAQFFPSGRTAKLRNDILMFQQHHGESLSEAWTRFKDLLQKVPHHGIDRWLQIQIFYDHVSFHLKCEIDRAAGGKLRDKNTDESWEIIENLALYDHEGWNDTKEFVKPVKAISTPQSTSKTPDRRLLELEDQINFLLKGSRPTPRPSSTHIPQAYAKAVYSNPRPQNQNEPPKQNPFTFRERTGPNPQPQALGTTFEARVRDYMAARTKTVYTSLKLFSNTKLNVES